MSCLRILARSPIHPFIAREIKVTNFTSAGNIALIRAGLYVTFGILTESFFAQGCSVNVKPSVSETVWSTFWLRHEYSP